MNNRKKEELTEYLENKWYEDIVHIVGEYGDSISPQRRNYILNFNRFNGNLILDDTGGFGGYSNGNEIHLNASINTIFNIARFLPFYKIANLGKKDRPRNLTNPKNNILTYAAHCFFDGIGTKRCMEEVLLHEVMHFSGSNGATPLGEGLTELKTRELAQKCGLRATGCGYPREVAVASRLQGIIGKEVMDKITFSENPSQTYSILLEHGGEKLVDLWRACEITMQKQFADYYEKAGNSGPISTIFARLQNSGYKTTQQIIAEYEKALETGDFTKFYGKLEENNIESISDLSHEERAYLLENETNTEQFLDGNNFSEEDNLGEEEHDDGFEILDEANGQFSQGENFGNSTGINTESVDLSTTSEIGDTGLEKGIL